MVSTLVLMIFNFCVFDKVRGLIPFWNRTPISALFCRLELLGVQFISIPESSGELQSPVMTIVSSTFSEKLAPNYNYIFAN